MILCSLLLCKVVVVESEFDLSTYRQDGAELHRVSGFGFAGGRGH